MSDDDYDYMAKAKAIRDDYHAKSKQLLDDYEATLRLRIEVDRLNHTCHDDCQRDACVLRREVERLKADTAPKHPGHWPIGTNLLTAEQARAMLEHVLSASDQPSAGPLEKGHE